MNNTIKIESDKPNELIPHWWIPLHGEFEGFRYDVGRDCAYEWMKMLSKQRTAKRLYWFNAYAIKHHVENWKIGNPTHNYVSKDMVVAAAMLVGLPVAINSKNKFRHEVGLFMTELQYDKFQKQANVKVP